MRKSDRRICITRPPYPEFFLRVFGNDGKLSYKIKCIGIGLILYSIGFVVNAASGTLREFVGDIGFFTNSILSGMVILGVIYICRNIDSTLKTMDTVINHSKSEKFEGFIKKWNSEPVWFIKERYFYHFHTISLAILLSLWSYLGWIGNYGWVIVTPTNRLYHLFWSAVIGYMTGIAVNRFGNYTFIVNEYCELFIEPSKLTFLSSKTKEVFKSLGKLALKADIVLAIPTVAILVNSLAHWLVTGAVLPFSKIPYILMIVTYVCTLIFVFLYPLKNAHKRMVQIRKKEIESIDNNLSSILADNTGPVHAYSTIGAILSTRDRIARISTWPVSLRSTIGASLIFLLPVFTGAVIQLLLDYVISDLII